MGTTLMNSLLIILLLIWTHGAVMVAGGLIYAKQIPIKNAWVIAFTWPWFAYKIWMKQ